VFQVSKEKWRNIYEGCPNYSDMTGRGLQWLQRINAKILFKFLPRGIEISITKISVDIRVD
jgi:hypothetical protein